MEKSTKIQGFIVTFMEFDDGTGNSNNCYIERGDFSSSLALADDTGGIEDGNGDFLPINPITLSKITTWAIAQGY